MAIMTVYHGGYQAVEKPEIRKGRNTKDFGTGFYCTIIKEQAQRWARRYDTKVVSVYDVRLKSNLKIKEFKDMTEEWLDFIIACRSGKDHEYDIVMGKFRPGSPSLPIRVWSRMQKYDKLAVMQAESLTGSHRQT